MKHKLSLIVLSLIAILMATLSFGATSTSKAATVPVAGLTADQAQITDQSNNPVTDSTSMYNWETYQLTYNWSVASNQAISAGDTATVYLPTNVAPTSNLNIPILDSSGNSLGNFTIDKGAKTGTMTFSKAIAASTTAQTGSFSFYVNGINTDANNPDQFVVNKYGWLSGLTNNTVPTSLTWNIAFNSSGDNLTNVILTDTLGPNQTYVPGSVQANNGYYLNGQFMIQGTLDPKVDVNGNQITFNFDNVSSAVNMIYLVKVSPNPNEANSWNNSVTLKSDQVSGTSSHTIEYGGSGSGSQVSNGSVLMSLTDATKGTSLAGATFNIEDANGNVVKENLVTDTNGQINCDALTPGTYYFVETKSPEGYVLNDAKTSFTVTSGKNSTVAITNKATDPVDPPATDPTDPPTVDPVDPPATDQTDPSIVDPTDPVDPPTTDPSDPAAVDPSDPASSDPTDPKENSDSSTTDSKNPVDPPVKSQSQQSNSAIEVIGDPPEEAPAEQVMKASKPIKVLPDPATEHDAIYPATGKLPQTGNSNNDSILESIAGVIILFIIGSEYLFWKARKG